MDDSIKCILLLSVVAAMLWSVFATEAEDGAVIYIKPSPDAMCPAESCYTLSQFAANQSQSQLQFNTTLILLSGNHSLNSIISIADIAYLSMLTYYSSSSFSTVQCQRNASISFSNITNVTIHGLVFYGCGENTISSVDELIIQNCSFIGSEKSGTALNMFRSNAVIINSFFLLNRIGTYNGPLMILEEQLEGDPTDKNFTTYAYVGGVMITNQSNVSINGSKFEQNHAGMGGVVFSARGSQISVINSTFTENSVCYLWYQYKYSVCFGGAFF